MSPSVAASLAEPCIAGRRAVGQTAAVDERSNLPPPGPALPGGASGEVLRDVLGRLAEGVSVVDAAGAIRYANAEAMRIWGFSDPAQVPATAEGFAPRFELRDLMAVEEISGETRFTNNLVATAGLALYLPSGL